MLSSRRRIPSLLFTVLMTTCFPPLYRSQCSSSETVCVGECFDTNCKGIRLDRPFGSCQCIEQFIRNELTGLCQRWTPNCKLLNPVPSQPQIFVPQQQTFPPRIIRTQRPPTFEPQTPRPFFPAATRPPLPPTQPFRPPRPRPIVDPRPAELPAEFIQATQIDRNFRNPILQDLSEFEHLYRLYHRGRRDHFYTSYYAESSVATKDGFTFEGISGRVADNPTVVRGPCPGLRELHRLYSSNIKNHFYTTKEADMEAAIGGGYQDEGIMGWCVIESLPESPPGDCGTTVKLHRFWNQGIGDHAYVHDESDYLALNNDPGWTYEGVECWIWPDAYGQQDIQQSLAYAVEALQNGASNPEIVDMVRQIGQQNSTVQQLIERADIQNGLSPPLEEPIKSKR